MAMAPMLTRQGFFEELQRNKLTRFEVRSVVGGGNIVIARILHTLEFTGAGTWHSDEVNNILINISMARACHLC